MDTFLATLFLIICVLLIVVVLLQKGRGVGLTGMFGGAGSSAFGTRTGDVFTWVTIVLTVVFLLLAVGTQIWFRPAPSQVATPTFIPAPEPIERTIRVAIRCHTLDAEVFYTLDGTEPTRESLPYDKTTVPVKPNTTLKAKAFLRGWHDSDPAAGLYPHPSKVKPPASKPADTKPAPATAPATKTAPAP